MWAGVVEKESTTGDDAQKEAERRNVVLVLVPERLAGHGSVSFESPTVGCCMPLAVTSSQEFKNK